MDTPSILITQCLQNDFVKPIGRYDSLPNLLHIGYEEAKRLMGENPQEGPVATIMQWAYQQPDEEVKLINIRDWHAVDDPTQEDHLRRFGQHCRQSSDGAQFAFQEPDTSTKDIPTINSLTLNDFYGTDLEAVLEPHRGKMIKVGLIGVWTEAKITFLAYELKSRYPTFQLAVCSALTASSSTAQHFVALDQLERILGVKIIPSMGNFIEFLGGEDEEIPLVGFHDTAAPQVINKDEAKLAENDKHLVRYLFRDCREVRVKALDGGFSGNVVLGTESVDMHGHEQVAHVVKIGPRDLIGKERASFERIESVLGNSAPRIAAFADLAERGAIKYRYASMGGGFSTTFQKLYMSGAVLERIGEILEIVFVNQLGRFYTAKKRERVDLLDYYCFKPEYARGVQSKVSELLAGEKEAQDLEGDILSFSSGISFPNVAQFYGAELDVLPRNPGDSNYFSYVHGDLNGANIIIDAPGNVWLIDFFHTHRGHVLKDLIKLENDLLYIFTPVSNEQELREACRLTDLLLAVEDLGQPLPEYQETGLQGSQFVRAYQTVCMMRAFYPELIESDRDSLQLVIGQLRYAVHTLYFEESNHWQKLWALYAAGHCGRIISERLRRRDTLRLDWLDSDYTSNGRLGISILPGRKDYYRDLERDLQTLRDHEITHAVCLVPAEELARYGVSGLLERYQETGFAVYHMPIVDQFTCSMAEMQQVVSWISNALDKKGKIFIHCVGGLGRSGMVAACYLKTQGLAPEEAIARVRKVRGVRAVETPRQENFVREFCL